MLKPKTAKKKTETVKTEKPVLKLVKVTDIDPDELPVKRRKAS